MPLMNRARWYGVAATVLLLAQGHQLGRTIVHDLNRAFSTRHDYERDPGTGINFELSAYRSLKRVSAEIPKGAKVLLVTAYPNSSIAWEYYFPDHSFVFLQLVDRDASKVLTPELARAWIRWHDHLVRKKRLFSKERFAEELRRADYLVEFFPGLQMPARGLELVMTHEHTRLYRINHEELR